MWFLNFQSFGFVEFEKLINKCDYKNAFALVEKLPASGEKTYCKGVLLMHFGALEMAKSQCYQALSISKNDLLNGKIYQMLFDISYFLSDVEQEKIYADSCYYFYKKMYGNNSIYKAQYNINLVRYYNYFRRSDLAEPLGKEALQICNNLPTEKFKIDYPMVFAQYYSSFRNNEKLNYRDNGLIYCDSAIYWHNKIHHGIDNFSKIKLYQIRGMVYLDRNTGSTVNNQWSDGKIWLNKAKTEFDKANKILTKNIGNNHILLSFGNALIGLLHQQQTEYDIALKFYAIAEKNLYPTQYSKQFNSPFIINAMSIYDWQNNCYYSLYLKSSKINHLIDAIIAAKKAEKIYEILLFEGKTLNDYFSHIPYQKLANLYYELYTKTKKSTYLDSSFYYAEKEKIASIIIQKKLANSHPIHSSHQYDFIENEILKNNNYFGETSLFKTSPTKQSIATNTFNLINSVKQLQGKIKDDSTAIVLYSLYNIPVGLLPKTVCFIITKKDFIHKSFELEYQHELKDSIDLLLNSIMSNNINLFKNTSYFAYHSLFAPISTIIPKRINKLQICPISRYRTFPFEVLIENKNSQTFLSQPYLLRKYAISYLISPSLTYSQENNNVKSLFVFNPDFKNGNQSELPFNLKCSKWINTNFSNTKYSRNTLKSDLINGLENNKIIHLATHAVGYDDYTNQSRIYTSDTALFLSEVFALKLKKNPFIVLTCCEADKGNLQYNVGNDNFSRAFTFAGATSVLSTIWSIDDQASAEMMKQFYQNLSNGMDKSIALQQAKLSILNNETLRSASPFYWAASVLTGDISTIDLQVKTNNNWLYFSAIAIVLIVLIVFRKKLFFKMMK